MNTRCEAVDWWNWVITESASQAVDFFKVGIAFLAGRAWRKKPQPPQEIKPLSITGGIQLNINPVLSGTVSLGPLPLQFQQEFDWNELHY